MSMEPAGKVKDSEGRELDQGILNLSETAVQVRDTALQLSQFLLGGPSPEFCPEEDHPSPEVVSFILRQTDRTGDINGCLGEALGILGDLLARLE